MAPPATTRLDLPPSSLRLDAANPRLARTTQDQAGLVKAVAREQGSAFLVLVEDIAAYGLDPLSLFGVVGNATSAGEVRCVVIDGNRRLAAVRVLESPALLDDVCDDSDRRRLATAAVSYSRSPIVSVECHRFEHRDASNRWRQLRHTGANGGAGVMPWRRQQAERFAEEAAMFPIEQQVITFLAEANELPSDVAASRGLGMNLRVFLDDVEVRRRLGLAVRRGRVLSCFPLTEIVKPLAYVALTLARPDVDNLLLQDARITSRWIGNLPRRVVPRPSTRLSQPVPLLPLLASRVAPADAPVPLPP